MNQFNSATAQFGDFSKSAADTAAQFAQVSFANIERMFALNLEAAKVSFGEVARNSQAVSSVKDANDLNTIRTQAAETGLEFITGYAKNFYDISAQAQAQYGALVEARVGAAQKQLVESLDQAAKNAPAGSEAAFSAIKNGLAASTAAFDAASKASKQVNAFADNAFKTTTENVAKAKTAKRK